MIYKNNSVRLIGGLTLLIILTLDGNNGTDLLDAIINYTQNSADLLKIKGQ